MTPCIGCRKQSQRKKTVYLSDELRLSDSLRTVAINGNNSSHFLQLLVITALLPRGLIALLPSNFGVKFDANKLSGDPLRSYGNHSLQVTIIATVFRCLSFTLRDVRDTAALCNSLPIYGNQAIIGINNHLKTLANKTTKFCRIFPIRKAKFLL